MVLRGRITGTCRDKPPTTFPIFGDPPHRFVWRLATMNRKWLAFPLSAGILIVLGIIAGPGLLEGRR